MALQTYPGTFMLTGKSIRQDPGERRRTAASCCFTPATLWFSCSCSTQAVTSNGRMVVRIKPRSGLTSRRSGVHAGGGPAAVALPRRVWDWAAYGENVGVDT